MRTSLVIALGLAPLAGCSLLLDVNDLPTSPPDAPDAPVAVDAPTPDAPPDSNPELLDLAGLIPDVIDEGIGTGQGLPGVLVLEGTSILASATFELVPADPRVHLGAWIVSPEGTLAAATYTVDVDEGFDQGENVALQIKVTQGVATTAMVPLTLHGLDEWITTAAGTRATTAIKPRYSRVEIAHATQLTGDPDHPALIRAAGAIEITAALTASASGADGGPGGCNGGGGGMAGGCQGGGGAPGGFSGIQAGGGGGGGFAFSGDPGGNAGHGTGGFPTGDLELSSLIVAPGTAGNRGNGGGGGGGTKLGGGGGGTIVLDAGGTISVSGPGVAANGGGGEASGLCIQVLDALGDAAGGGGSGGAIVVRSRVPLDVTPAAWISVAPGPGGTSAGACGGGLGSIGKVRVDAPATVFGSWSLATLFRGPAWQDPPAIVRQPSVMLTLTGLPARTFPILRDGVPLPDAAIGPLGTADVTVTGLVRGHNRICAKVTAGAVVTDPDAVTCTDIVYVPE